jgi:molybdopterin-containing oxidoreductase family membrane subunit
MSASKHTGVLGVFEDPHKSVEAVRKLKEEGYAGRIEVFAAVPPHGMLEEFEVFKSPVGWFTLVGGLTGCAAGFILCIGLALTWDLMVGGKLPEAIPPYVVIAFELTILIGALSTVVGLFLHTKLGPPKLHPAYDPRFSEDQVGVFVNCAREKMAEVEGTLRGLGAEEVRVEYA